MRTPTRSFLADSRTDAGWRAAGARRLVLVGALTLFAVVVRAQEAAAPVLTRAAEVLNLSEAEAERAVPVRLRGVVVGDAPPVGKAFVLWDGSEFIYVRRPDTPAVVLERGDEAEIEGHSGAGGFAPLVYMAMGRRIGAGTPPPARTLSFEQLVGGQFDAQWVRVRGIVRACEPSEPWAGRWRLTLAMSGRLLSVHVNTELSPERLVDAEIAVEGVYLNQHNLSRQFIRALLFVPRDAAIETLVPAPEDPFGLPVRPVGRLLQFERRARYGHRVHVRGQVIHHVPGDSLWIRDGDHGLRVLSVQAERLQPGDEVDVLGFPTQGGHYTPRLDAAVFRRCGHGDPPAPVLPADLRAAIVHDGDLIAVDARLVERWRTPEGVGLVLDWRGHLISAVWAEPGLGAVPAEWERGSVLRVTGICAVPASEPSGPSGTWEPRAFTLNLRSAADVTVRQPPPWWTRQRVLWGLGLTACASLLIAGGVTLVARRRLREQVARRAQAESEFAAILAERSRLAREIHDTLAQGLAAVSVQLELAKTTPPDDGAAIGRHVETAHRLVRGSLADARASIWNMRAQMLETNDLAGAIEGILRQLADGTQVAARCMVTGTRRRLPPVTENELLRIGQEAIVNAMKHAAPRHVDVRLEFSDQAVELAITDDGTGFDSEQAAARAGSYGLAGMRERAARIGARLTLETAPGRGTRVAVSAPAPA